jgi:hypothetical protein
MMQPQHMAREDGRPATIRPMSPNAGWSLDFRAPDRTEPSARLA